MNKTFSKWFIFDIGESLRGWGSKALETHSKKLRPKVSLPRKVAEPFEKKCSGSLLKKN